MNEKSSGERKQLHFSAAGYSDVANLSPEQIDKHWTWELMSAMFARDLGQMQQQIRELENGKE